MATLAQINQQGRYNDRNVPPSQAGIGNLYGPGNAPYTGAGPPGALDKADGNGGTTTPYVPYIPPAGQGQYQSSIPGAADASWQAHLSADAAAHDANINGPFDNQVPQPKTKAPPPAAVPTPQHAPAPDYYAEYKAQLAQAQAGLDQQYRGGLAAINAAGAASQAQVNQMPGQINTIYSDATAMGTPGAAQTAAANQAYASGEKGAKGTLAQSSASAVAMASNKATELSSVPQLHAVVQEDVANRSATLADAHFAAQEALSQHAADIAAAEAQGEQAHAWSVADATKAYDRAKTLAGIGKTNTPDAPSKLVPDMTNGDVTALTHSAPYTQWTTYINSGKVKPEDVVSTLSGGKDNVGGGLLPANPKMLQLLEELYPTFFKSVNDAAAASTTKK